MIFIDDHEAVALQKLQSSILLKEKMEDVMKISLKREKSPETSLRTCRRKAENPGRSRTGIWCLTRERIRLIELRNDLS